MAYSALGKFLVNEGIISEKDDRTIKINSGHHPGAYARGILALGILDDGELAAFIADHSTFQVAPQDLTAAMDPSAFEGLSADLAKKLEVLPLSYSKPHLTVAMVDPFDRETLRQVEFFSGHHVVPVIAPLRDLYNGLKEKFPDFEPHATDLEQFLSNHFDSIAQTWLQNQNALPEPRSSLHSEPHRQAPTEQRPAVSAPAKANTASKEPVEDFEDLSLGDLETTGSLDLDSGIGTLPDVADTFSLDGDESSFAVESATAGPVFDGSEAASSSADDDDITALFEESQPSALKASSAKISTRQTQALSDDDLFNVEDISAESDDHDDTFGENAAMLDNLLSPAGKGNAGIGGDGSLEDLDDLDQFLGDENSKQPRTEPEVLDEADLDQFLEVNTSSQKPKSAHNVRELESHDLNFNADGMSAIENDAIEIPIEDEFDHDHTAAKAAAASRNQSSRSPSSNNNSTKDMFNVDDEDIDMIIQQNSSPSAATNQDATEFDLDNLTSDIAAENRAALSTVSIANHNSDKTDVLDDEDFLAELDAVEPLEKTPPESSNSELATKVIEKITAKSPPKANPAKKQETVSIAHVPQQPLAKAGEPTPPQIDVITAITALNQARTKYNFITKEEDAARQLLSTFIKIGVHQALLLTASGDKARALLFYPPDQRWQWLDGTDVNDAWAFAQRTLSEKWLDIDTHGAGSLIRGLAAIPGESMGVRIDMMQKKGCFIAHWLRGSPRDQAILNELVFLMMRFLKIAN